MIRAGLARALLEEHTRTIQEVMIRGPAPLGPGAPGYDSLVDGCTGPGPAGCNAGDVATIDADRDGVPDLTVTRVRNAFPLTDPISGQQYVSELAAVSRNLLMVFATGGARPKNPPPDTRDRTVWRNPSL